MKCVACLFGLILTCIAIAGLVGARLNRFHTATRSGSYKRSRRELYEVVRNFAGTPAWRHGIKSVDVLSPLSYREISRHGAMTFRIAEDLPGEKVVIEIVDAQGPFGGSWTMEFSDGKEGSQLQITERGEVKNIFFRFLSRFVFGQTATIETYLKDLGRHFGEETTPSE